MSLVGDGLKSGVPVKGFNLLDMFHHIGHVIYMGLWWRNMSGREGRKEGGKGWRERGKGGRERDWAFST